MRLIRIFFAVSLLLTCIKAFATSPVKEASADSLKSWKFTSLNMLTINQIAFVNWAAGGESSLSAKVSTEYDLEYKKNKITFDHKGKLAFGLVGYIDKRIEKTDDIINLLWAVSYKTSKKWDLTGLLTFKSQFANGYKYPNDSTLISTFMAPGYFNLSVGFNFKPDDKFQIYMSPLAGKLTIVLDQELANKGAFGVKRAIVDTAGNIISGGENMLTEFGLNILTSYKHKVMKNIDLRTVLNFYNNYTDPNTSNRWNIDVDWDTRIVFTINKVFSSVLFVHLKYDHNTTFPEYEMVEGKQVIVSQSPKLQLKESFGLSFTYKI